MSSSQGKIFVSYERGLVKTPAVSHACTLNFKDFQHDHKQPLGPLYMINDDTLQAGGSAVFTASFSSLLITLPVTGRVSVSRSDTEPAALDVEQVRIDALAEGDELFIKNPYADEWVNYLQFAIKVQGRHLHAESVGHNFNLAGHQNQLVPLLPEHNSLLNLCMGMYNGRQESVYSFCHKHSILFAFVITGAFELEGRLLHERDGLALWNTPSVELEALSDGAVIFLLEIDIQA